MNLIPRPAMFVALARLVEALASTGRAAMLIGGLAVIARGVPRHTIDIHATIDGDGLDADRLIEVLGPFGIVARIPNALEFARQRQVLLLAHTDTGTTIDLALGWLVFEREAIARATPVAFAGTIVPVVTVADLIVLKAVAWRPRDRADIERLGPR